MTGRLFVNILDSTQIFKNLEILAIFRLSGVKWHCGNTKSSYQISAWLHNRVEPWVKKGSKSFFVMCKRLALLHSQISYLSITIAVFMFYGIFWTYDSVFNPSWPGKFSAILLDLQLSEFWTNFHPLITILISGMKNTLRCLFSHHTFKLVDCNHFYWQSSVFLFLTQIFWLVKGHVHWKLRAPPCFTTDYNFEVKTNKISQNILRFQFIKTNGLSLCVFFQEI